MTNKSFTMAGVSSCSGSCLYCSAALSQNYTQPYIYLTKDKMDSFAEHIDAKTAKEYKADWDHFRLTIDHDIAIQHELEEAARQNRKPVLKVDIWGANPLSCWTAFKDSVQHFQEIFADWDLTLSTSDNGIGLNKPEKLKFLVNNNIHLQLSHDGIGEWMRLPFDPLKEEPYKSLWMEALAKGIWDATNCTLSFYNSSFFNNLNYWNEILDTVKPATHYLKLNHSYSSTYDIKAINKDGRWQNTTIEELKGKPLGRWELHNGTNEWDKHVLDDYLSEFMHLAILCFDPTLQNDPRFKYVRNYMMDQFNRHSFVKDHECKTGACRAFQRFKHKIGDPDSWDDQTFVIDTLGNYSECNLIDSEHSVENPGGPQPEYCKGCRFEMAKECNGCGSMPFENSCEYLYKWNQMLEICMWIRAVCSSTKEAERQRIINNIIGTCKCQKENF